MSGKWMATGATLLACLGLAGALQSAPTPMGPPQTAPADGDGEGEQRVEVRVIGAGEQDAAEVLQEAYDILRRLRAERLEERPREMLERAVSMYREAVAAYGDEKPERQQAAQGMATAVRELARAVERLRNARVYERVSPDLPPPPAPKVVRRSLRTAEVPVPPLPPALPADEAPGAPAAPPVPPVVAAAPVAPVTPDDIQSIEIRGTPEGDVIVARTPAGRGKAVARKFEVRVDPSAPGADGRSPRVITLAPATPGARAVGAATIALAPTDSTAQARRDLQRAYEAISKARREFKGPEEKFYLDAARDLYNAARRDAEAGRNARASELARAAEALTLVPKNLAPPERTKAKADDTRRPREKRIQHFEFRLTPDGKLEGKGPETLRFELEGRLKEQLEKARAEAEAAAAKALADGVKARERVKVEVRTRVEGEEGADSKDKDADDEKKGGDPEKMEGLGLTLTQEDGKLVVLSVIPDSPAARDGRIKEGDVLVGVVRGGDDKVEFEGKELSEVVKELRGKSGSRVTLIIRPKDQGDTKILELIRGPIPVPAASGDDDQDDQKEEPSEKDRSVSKPAEGAAEELPPPLP